MKYLEFRFVGELGQTANYTHVRFTLEYLQVELHMLINLHDGCFVSAAVTVVRCAKYCDYVAFM